MKHTKLYSVAMLVAVCALIAPSATAHVNVDVPVDPIEEDTDTLSLMSTEREKLRHSGVQCIQSDDSSEDEVGDDVLLKPRKKPGRASLPHTPIYSE